MPFVRISLMKPKQGSEQRAQDLIDQLTRYHEQQAGFLGGYTLCLADGGELGRVMVWEDAGHANRVATSEHDLKLRSELNLAVEPGSHRESSFDGLPAVPRGGGQAPTA